MTQEQSGARIVELPYRQALIDSPNFDPYLIGIAESHVRRECTEGYLYVEHEESADWLLFFNSQPYLAARVVSAGLRHLSVSDFFRDLHNLSSFRFQLCRTHPGVMMLLAVSAQNRASFKVPTSMVPAQRVFAELEIAGRDAAVVMTTGRERSVAYLLQGKPIAVYFAVPGRVPGAATLHEQLLAYCNTPADNEAVVIAAYHDLTTQPDPSAGHSFAEHAGSDRPPPFLLTVRHAQDIVVRRLFDNGEATVGRDLSNDVIIDHRSVSRRHCEIHWDGSAFRVRDSGSSGGTTLNGKKIREAALRLGDLLTVGDFRVRFGNDPQRVEQSDLRTVFIPGEAAQTAKLVYGTRVIAISKPVFSIGRGRDASFRVKGIFIRPIQATIVRDREERYRLMPADGGVKVTVAGHAITRAGAPLRSGDEIAIGRHRFVFMLGNVS